MNARLTQERVYTAVLALVRRGALVSATTVAREIGLNAVDGRVAARVMSLMRRLMAAGVLEREEARIGPAPGYWAWRYVLPAEGLCGPWQSRNGRLLDEATGRSRRRTPRLESDGDGAPATARPPRKRRPCLRCRRPFMSEGAHNRLCGACRSFVNREAAGLPLGWETAGERPGVEV